jgi:SAM-dependent methyltransferase
MKDFWNDRYKTEDYFYGTIPNAFLEKSVGILKNNSNILCIGEGEGRNAVFLSLNGFQVTAVDFSEEGRKKALELSRKHKVILDYRVCPLEDFDFELEKWDAVISIFCHLPPVIRQIVHARLEKGLKTGGFFIFQAYNPDQLHYQTGGPKDINMLYTDFLIKNDFQNLEWRFMENSVEFLSEGSGHHGPSSLLAGIGRKK